MQLCLLILIVVLAVDALAAPLAEWPTLEIGEEYIDDDASIASSMISTVHEELGNFFEGDMVLTLSQRRAVQFASSARNGLKESTKRWPNNTVTYHVVKSDFDEKELIMIEEAMQDISNKSCLKFRQRQEGEHAVSIQGSAKGCFSSVGYIASNSSEGSEVSEGQTSVQVLNLSKGCFSHGTVVHEILHTLGFYHMQSSYDRDEFVVIVWENIRSGTEHNFEKYTMDTVSDFGVRYDYGSVMHYPDKAFSKNGNQTIIPLQEGVNIGQRTGLSERDILKLNRMYCEDETAPIRR